MIVKLTISALWRLQCASAHAKLSLRAVTSLFDDEQMHATQAKQLAEWGVEGVIVGSALVKALGEAPSPVRPNVAPVECVAEAGVAMHFILLSLRLTVLLSPPPYASGIAFGGMMPSISVICACCADEPDAP